MAKLIVTIVAWGLCILGAVMVQWFPQFAFLVPVFFISIGMLGWATVKQKRGDIAPKNAPKLFQLLSALGLIGGVALLLHCLWVQGNGGGAEVVDGVFYLTRKGHLLHEITGEEYRALMRAEFRWFFGIGIVAGSIALNLWAADYWWYGPSIFNTRVREFFKFHK